MTRQKPVVLCILDGWGHRTEGADNSILQAHTPHWDQLWNNSPHSLLQASAESVGLPEGQMGNSEVGHITLGAGRIIYQDLPRIDKAIIDNGLADRPQLISFIEKLQTSGGACHLLGLLSPGGIHSHQRHILTLAQILASLHIPVIFHPFLDGRDTPPQSAGPYLDDLIQFCDSHRLASIGTVGGRYYGMDRDQRWDRVQKAYDAMTSGKGPNASDALQALKTSYDENITDEFVIPTVLEGYEGMKDGDALLMANFRSDRARQILQAFCDPTFEGFQREKFLQFSATLGMVEYSAQHAQWMDTLFPPLQPVNTLGEVISSQRLRQLRIAETEKYAHVTFFFNGGREETFEGEDRILVPSPKVATYDQKPEMSAPEVTDQLVQAIESGIYDLIIVNYANTDMVGHTGNQYASEKAVEAVDTCLGRLMDSIRRTKGILAVTADHGNVEVMANPTVDAPHTAHTLNPVPFVVYNAHQNRALDDGKLADVAPTLLDLMGLSIPIEFTGKSLLCK